jgi:hypothetical protein
VPSNGRERWREKDSVPKAVQHAEGVAVDLDDDACVHGVQLHQVMQRIDARRISPARYLRRHTHIARKHPDLSRIRH